MTGAVVLAFGVAMFKDWSRNIAAWIVVGMSAVLIMGGFVALIG